MNKSTLSERRNKNLINLDKSILKIPTQKGLVKRTSQIGLDVRKGLKQYRASSFLDDNQEETDAQFNQKLTNSYKQIPLLSSGSTKVQNMLNQAAEMYVCEQNPFENNFIIEQKLGQGAHGVVKKCIHKQSKKVYAVKILKMEDEHFRSIRTNFISIKQLKNDHIIKYKALYLSSKNRVCHLVMEYLPYKRLHKGLKQTILRIIFHKIIDAIAYIHEKNICHRDLKPDNILFDQKSKSLKIIDFGVSKNMKLRGRYEEMLTNTGQLYYKAPQMFQGGSYNEKVDSWSIGITLYELITGKTPFENEYMIETIHNIQSKPLQMDHQNFARFSPLVKDLIEKLLQRDPKKRITCKQAGMHFWFLPHLHNVDLMKSAGYSLQFFDNMPMRVDKSMVMNRGNAAGKDNLEAQQLTKGEKVTKGQKVAMKSWLEMISEDNTWMTQDQYKFQFVESESEDQNNPFGASSSPKRIKKEQLEAQS